MMAKKPNRIALMTTAGEEITIKRNSVTAVGHGTLQGHSACTVYTNENGKIRIPRPISAVRRDLRHGRSTSIKLPEPLIR